MDNIDAKILEVLQEDARISISDLSKKVNLSLSAVSDRLKKLEASKVIRKYTAIIDAKLMEREVSSLIYACVSDASESSEFVKFAAGCSDIISALRITGHYDFILKASVKDMNSLELLLDKLKKIKSVKELKADIILGDVKEGYSVPPLYK